MPTENRSSNTEMVSVPRVPTDEMIVAFAEAWYSKRQTIDDPDMLDAYAAMLAVAPAQQHQGEPVAYRQRFICPDEGPSSWVLTDSNVLDGRPGWEVVPLYTHADPAEVERLREGISKHWEVVCDQRAELDKLRAQLATCTDARETLSAQLRAAHTKLAERDALLREIASIPGDSINYHATHMSRIARAALSASAEPSAPKCTYCGDTGQIMVGRSGDANDGNAPIMEPCEDCDGSGSSGGQMHSNGIDAPEYEPFKCETCSGFGIVGNILNAEPCPDCSYSAPVECGHWLPLSAPGQIQVGDWLCFTVSGSFICAQARLIIYPGTDKEEIVYNRKKNHYFCTDMAIAGTSNHKGVLVARAALDHKPS